MNEYVLELKGISKSFPGVKALDRVDLKLKKGSIHAVCGENGAGKSTLMKIINGLYEADEGEVFIDGEPVHVQNPRDARAKGIAMVFQELSYVPTMTISENIFLNKWPMKFPFIDWKIIENETVRLLREEKLDYHPNTLLSALPISDLQMLEIIKASFDESKILILDEPTSALSLHEIKSLFKKIRQLQNDGVSIIYISHKLDEVFELADTITVLRDGELIITDSADNLSHDTLIEHMVGRRIGQQFPDRNSEIGDEYFRVEKLNKKGVFKDVSFYVKKGEIIGFGGLMGAGRTEVFNALFGLDNFDYGEIIVDGEKVKFKHIGDRIKQGLGYLTEDRSRTGIVPIMSVKHNISLASLSRVFFNGHLHKQLEEDIAKRIGEKMSLKTPSYSSPIMNLSGGNQQKALLAKWLLCEPDVLIVDEPTRGIDVDAKREIYELLNEFVGNNKSVIMISSELPELIGMCDRIYVMSGGTITGELTRDEFSQETIMKYAIQ